jgi:molecular chaperone DnaK (HSP70)
MIVAGEAYPAEELLSVLVRWVVDLVAEREGGSPDHIVLTCPANWGGYRKSLLHHALRRQDLGNPTLLSAAIVAGESFVSRDRVDSGGTLAIYDLGADGMAASVVRRTAGGVFEPAGRPVTVRGLGGSRLDDLLVEHVRVVLGPEFDDLDLADPRARSICSALRKAARWAKERLSMTGEVTIPTHGASGEIRLTRAEFEELIRPTVDASVRTLVRAVRSAQGAADQPDSLVAAVLVGGSSRIPLVAESVSAGLSCRVAVETDPDLTLARGAALAAVRLASGSGAPRAVRLPAPPTSTQQTTVLTRTDTDPPSSAALVPVRFGERPDTPPPPRPEVDIPPLDLPSPRSPSDLVPGARPGVLGAIVLVGAALVVVLTFVFQGTTSSSQPVQSPISTMTTGTGHPTQVPPASPTTPQG